MVGFASDLKISKCIVLASTLHQRFMDNQQDFDMVKPHGMKLSLPYLYGYKLNAAA